jgi:opacity protein-like surface antigen
MRTTILAAILCSSLATPARAQEEAQAQAVIPAGTWEIFGTAELSSGNGTTFAVDAGTGYFLSEMHQIGGKLDLVLANADALGLLPFYRFHLPLSLDWLVPYAEAGAGLLFEHQPEGGNRNNPQPAQDDVYFILEGALGAKLMGSPRWSLLVQLGLSHAFGRGTDPTVSIFSGFSVYL